MCKIIDDIIERECKKASIDTARRMIDKNKYSVEEIAEMSNLCISEVEKLIKERSA